MNQPPFPPQEPPQYEVSYPPPRPSYPQQAYPQQGGYPPTQPRKSRLPLIIAVGLVVALAIGITLFLVLRDPDKDVAGGGGRGGKPGPEEITKTFFVAVDEVDEPVLKKLTRGEVADDVEKIVDTGASGSIPVKFGKGKSGGTQSKKIGSATIAVVLWMIDDAPSSAGGGLTVGLLDVGDGYQLCVVDDIKGPDADAKSKLADFEKQWESDCDYSK